jgi:hypothetical protein
MMGGHRPGRSPDGDGCDEDEDEECGKQPGTPPVPRPPFADRDQANRHLKMVSEGANSRQWSASPARMALQQTLEASR